MPARYNSYDIYVYGDAAALLPRGRCSAARMRCRAAFARAPRLMPRRQMALIYFSRQRAMRQAVCALRRYLRQLMRRCRMPAAAAAACI